MERGQVGTGYLTFSHWNQLSHLTGRDPVWADPH